jgi:hypothetical protein
MSSRGNVKGRGRGRGAKAQSPPSPEVLENPVNDALESDFSPPEQIQPERSKKHRAPSKSPEELRRTMDIVKRSITMVIDNLEENDNEASLKRSVMIAIKHLKQIESML